MTGTELTRDTCLQAFRILDEEARKRDIRLEIAVYGGCAMLLRFSLRASTHDIDVRVKGASQSELLSMSLEAGEKLGLEPGWINQAVAIFASRNEKDNDFDCIDIGDNLSVYLASPEYLLAMKVMAMRTESDSHDREDIEFLIDELKLESSEEALKIVCSYYSREKLNPRSIMGLEEIFQERSSAKLHL